VQAPIDVAAALARATRDLAVPQGLDATLETIVTVARDSLSDIDHVGITLAEHDGPLQTRVASDPIVYELDRIQYDVGEGPCLEAMAAGPVVRAHALRHDQRWPRFVPLAVARGVRSQLGIRLQADEHTSGALNLYSLSSDTISEDTEQLAELFATHAGIALGHARRIENLNAALENRRVIGLAIGMIMQRLDLDEDTAFSYLTRVSSSSETKLRDVAADIVAQHHARLRGGGTDEDASGQLLP